MVLVVKDIIVVFGRNETILILMSLIRYFSHPEKSILKETKSATMNIFRFFLIFFLNHL